MNRHRIAVLVIGTVLTVANRWSSTDQRIGAIAVTKLWQPMDRISINFAS